MLLMYRIFQQRVWGKCSPNNKFKSDSQRSALLLQVSLVFMAQWFS
ncbi:hypothetical protein OA39_05066 [Vibrio campbellii]|nr:hypothetical protein OA39_05066 [Vibrio campbellii]